MPTSCSCREVQDRNDRPVAAALFDPDHTQLNYTATDAYPHAVYGRNAVYDHGHHGNAILSRHPILMSENLDISDHRFEQRGLLHAVADVNGIEAHLICVHFGLFARSRAPCRGAGGAGAQGGAARGAAGDRRRFQ